MESGRNQSLVITGESGAGKTTMSRLTLRYITAVSSLLREGATNDLEDRIVAAGPILEGAQVAENRARAYSSSLRASLGKRQDASQQQLVALWQIPPRQFLSVGRDARCVDHHLPARKVARGAAKQGRTKLSHFLPAARGRH